MSNIDPATRVELAGQGVRESIADLIDATLAIKPGHKPKRIEVEGDYKDYRVEIYLTRKFWSN